MIDRMQSVQTKRRRPTSKPATPDPFAMLAETMLLRDQRGPQGRPFLSLSKGQRRTIQKHTAASRRISQPRYCNHPTRDVAIRPSAKSSPTSGNCQSRTFRLVAIGRARANCECKSLKRALARLTSAVIRVTIRQLKLAIEHADFAPSGRIEPWSSRIARNDTGGQQEGYRFARRRFHGESESLSRRRPKIHSVFLQEPPRSCTYETRAISFARPPTHSSGRRRSSPPSSLTELLWHSDVPSRTPHSAGRNTHKASQFFVLLSMNNDDGSVHE
jgi:hypothetical protein